MRYTLFLTLALLMFPVCVNADELRVIETPDQNEVMPLEHPRRTQAIYGNLEGYPHMFEFATKEPFELSTELLVPDIELARDNVSGIILFVNRNGSVREVARLRAREASWESFYDFWGGDAYRRGASFKAEIEPGTYRIEVSTPDNIGKYVLIVGTESSYSVFGYFGRIARAADVKAFFGKSKFRIIESPFVYGPIVLGILAVCAYLIPRRLRRGVQ